MPVIDRTRAYKQVVFGAVVSGSAALFTVGAYGQTPAAIVEDIESRSAGVEFMDYLPAGTVVKLSAGDRLVLGYLRSCWREVVVGGTVTVGADQSRVEAGQVERTRVQCNGGHMQLSQGQAEKSGALSFRQGPRGQKAATESAQRTIHGLSPIIEVQQSGTLMIERVDRAGEHRDVEVSPAMLMRGAFLDLGRSGVKLAAGGVYRVRMGSVTAVFRIAPDAGDSDVPVIARLVRLAP